jgi:hypothetical protein
VRTANSTASIGRVMNRGPCRGLALCLAALVGSGCTATLSVSTPDFARRPFEPFSRAAAVAIALREWRLFGERYDDRSACAPPVDSDEDPPERREGLWQRVGEYRWLGLGARHPRRAGTGKHDAHGRVYPPSQDETYAWSAAFVSYVMRIAGAGDRFVYDDRHATYINQAARAARGEEPVRAAIAMRPERYAPLPGDVICAGREWAADLRFDDLPAGQFPAHCAIVVEVRAGALLVVGGNVADSVTMTRVPATSGGMLATPDGTVVDPCTRWAVVLAIRYER